MVPMMSLPLRASVVILIVDQNGIAIFKCEGQAPVAIDPYRPMPAQVAEQRMEFPARYVHILGRLRFVQSTQLQAKAIGMSWLDAPRGSRKKEFLDAFVAERFDHGQRIVYRHTIQRGLIPQASAFSADSQNEKALHKGGLFRIIQRVAYFAALLAGAGALLLDAGCGLLLNTPGCFMPACCSGVCCGTAPPVTPCRSDTGRYTSY